MARPRTPTGIPSQMSASNVNVIHFVPGTTSTWLLSIQATNGTIANYNLISTDDGATWADLSAISGLPEACSGAKLGIGGYAIPNYIILSCGKNQVAYGPLA